MPNVTIRKSLHPANKNNIASDFPQVRSGKGSVYADPYPGGREAVSGRPSANRSLRPARLIIERSVVS